MKYFSTAYATDVGIKKNVNQDSLLLKGISNGDKEVVLAVLCDGMGGMSRGELASAAVVEAFSDWFMTACRKQDDIFSVEEARRQWSELLSQCNERLMEYGKKNQIQLGTTVTAVILFSSGNYLIVHIGDTRAYLLNDHMVQLTEDHTWVAREIKRGNLKKEDIESSSRRNVLLQCIGINEHFAPQFLEGKLLDGEALLLCSDGFGHKVSGEEIRKSLEAVETGNEAMAETCLRELAELNKQRQETDNITAIYIKRKRHAD